MNSVSSRLFILYFSSHFSSPMSEPRVYSSRRHTPKSSPTAPRENPQYKIARLENSLC